MNMKLARLLGFGSYLFWLFAVIIYGVAIFSSKAYIVQLSTSNSTEAVKVDMGYLQLCVSNPSTNGPTEQSSQKCEMFPSFNEDKTPSELATDWIEDLDLTTSPSGEYSSGVGSLLETARSLRMTMFLGTDLIAGFVLLIVGGLVLVVPIFFNFTYRRKICYALLMISSLILGFGLMVASAAVFTGHRTQSLLDSQNPLTSALARNSIFITKGKLLRVLIKAGLSLNGIFLVFIAITAFVRHNFNGKGGRVRSGSPKFEPIPQQIPQQPPQQPPQQLPQQLPQHLPLYETPNRKAQKPDGNKPKKEKKEKKTKKVRVNQV
ncbi:hypothetical protein QQX98_000867 [Neonectria punicea]|uniref:Uncharacterized protein n=1 Tax=Neonectria punicea TaxID=979145 RepID=A0ABR1HS77_9HYPO